MGFAFLIAALVLFILAGLGVALPFNTIAWGLACLTAGVLLSGVPLPWRRPP
jgi:hypothetical protein